jgi:hypothetical protein
VGRRPALKKVCKQGKTATIKTYVTIQNARKYHKHVGKQ